MMAINCPHPPRKYYKNNNNGIKELDLLALFALRISIYIATLGRKNLEINKKNAEVNNKIADELKRLNNSNILREIRTKISQEDEKNDIKINS